MRLRTTIGWALGMASLLADPVFRCRRAGRWLLGAAMVAVGVAPLYGADVNWNGNASDLQWSNTLNWSSGQLPGTNDRAILHGPSSATSGYPTNGIIHLGDHRTIKEFRLTNSAPPFIITGDGLYSLTLTNGSFSTDGSGVGSSTAAGNYIIDCDVTIGANAVWQTFGNGPNNKYCNSAVNGTLSDGGKGYSFTFTGDPFQNLLLNGPVTLSTSVTVVSANCTLGGLLGAMTNVDYYLMAQPKMNSGIFAQSVLKFDNNTYSNGDRFGDTRTIHNNFFGVIQMVGNGTNPVSETLGSVAIDSGALTLENDYYSTNVALVVKNITRQPGTAFLASYVKKTGTQVLGTNTLISIQGESVNTNGIWRPWAIFPGGTSGDSFVRVDANGCLIPLGTSDYMTLPAAGSLSTGIYHVATASTNLTSSEEIYGLRLDCTSDQVLNLGANDLTIGCGTLLFGCNGAKTITSSGGRLVFRTNEIFIAGTLGTSATNIVISAPIACTVAGPVYLCLPNLNYVNTMTLDGADTIGTYAGLTAGMRTYAAVLRLGGPSDRTINGPLVGQFILNQVGTGTLRLNGQDLRLSSGIDVKTGRVVIGHSAAVGAVPTVRNGARLDVASNIVFSLNFTAETNSTLGGDGTFGRSNPTLPAGLHFSPGETVGKMTMSNITIQANSVFDWDLGSGTNTAGVDYDLLHVIGSLTLTNAGMQVTVRDASDGKTVVRPGTVFTLADWTGTNPTNVPTWTISNASPKTLDASAATVLVNTNSGVQKILLSGLRSVTPRGTIVTFR